jgi:hypothetical protein
MTTLDIGSNKLASTCILAVLSSKIAAFICSNFIGIKRADSYIVFIDSLPALFLLKHLLFVI